MKPLLSHPWKLSPAEAVRLQKELASKVVEEGEPYVRLIAGIDVSVSKGSSVGFAAVVVLTYPDLQLVEVSCARGEVRVPYIPGLLSFRETPVIMAALEKLKHTPDLFMVDGQGIAHPRRFGIASHIGVLYDVPSVGVAKSRLVGEHDEPAQGRGSVAPLIHHGRVVGAVLRTRSGVKPVYVSVGHRVSLDYAVELVLNCCTRYRLPEPTRLAHIEVNRFRRSILEENSKEDV